MKKECMVCRKVFNDVYYKIQHEGMHYDSSNMFCEECLGHGYDKDYKTWQKKFDQERIDTTAFKQEIDDTFYKRSANDSEYYIRILGKKKEDVKEDKKKTVETQKKEIKKDKKDKKEVVKKLVKKFCGYYLDRVNIDENRLANYIINNLGEKNLQLCENHEGMRSIITDMTQEYIVKESCKSPLEKNIEYDRSMDTGVRRLQ